MSNEVNDLLMDRAHDVLEECQGHPSGYDKLLSEELNKPHPDLDEVERLVCILEGALAQSEFYGNNIIEATDVY